MREKKMQRSVYFVLMFLLLATLGYAEHFFVAVLKKETGYTEQLIVSKSKLGHLEKPVTQAWREGCRT